MTERMIRVKDCASCGMRREYNASCKNDGTYQIEVLCSYPDGRLSSCKTYKWTGNVMNEDFLITTVSIAKECPLEKVPVPVPEKVTDKPVVDEEIRVGDVCICAYRGVTGILGFKKVHTPEPKAEQSEKNNCYYNNVGFCTNIIICGGKSTDPLGDRNWDSKVSCVMTQYGAQKVCSGYSLDGGRVQPKAEEKLILCKTCGHLISYGGGHCCAHFKWSVGAGPCPDYKLWEPKQEDTPKKSKKVSK